MNQHRKNQIMLRLNDEEYQTVKMHADEVQTAPAVYVRQCVLNRKITAKKSKQIYGKYLNQLSWIGNNLNQIAKALNTANHSSNFNQERELNLLEINWTLSQIEDSLSELKEAILAEKEGESC